MDKYLVFYVPVGSEDLYHEEFATLQAATAFISVSDDKAILVKIENPGPNTTVEVEDHT